MTDDAAFFTIELMKRLTFRLASLAMATVAVASFARTTVAASPPCNGYANPVYIAGATSEQPTIQQFAAALGTQVSIIYQGTPSCVGISNFVTNTTESASAYYLDPASPTAPVQCDPTNGGTSAGINIDIGVSDVYPSTCGVSAGSGQKEFLGVISSYSFSVPLSQYTGGQTSISAEAAYVVFGWAGQTNTVAPWTDATQMFIRTPTSGTELLLAAAIGLPASKWLAQSPFDGGTAQQLGSSGAVVTALTSSTSAGAAIGILSSQYVDSNRSKLATLAFQGKDPNGPDDDQLCGYLPDSDSTHFDKINVRQGRYELWGPAHLLTNVDGGGNPIANPSNTGAGNVAAVVQYLTFASSLTSAQTQSVIQAAQKSYAIPPCAMEVTRTAEVGPEASFQPTGACGCYYESLTAGGTTTSSYCRTCASDADCADAGIYKHCNYTYCEAQ